MARMVKVVRRGRRRWFVLPLVMVAAAALVLAQGALSKGSTPTAPKRPVIGKRVALTCGQTVTTSVTLSADLTGCAARGLVVGANGITIDLGGHTIGGIGSQQGIFNASFNSVVIQNGKIEDFQRGVEVDGGTGTTMKSLRVTGNSGVGLFSFAPATISGNIVYANGGGGIAIGCCLADKSSITNNIVNGNTGNGISMSFTAAGSTVSGNRALSNSGDGIEVSAANVSVSGNTANANGSNGFVLSSSDTLPPLKASSNKANFNTGLGISFGAGDTDGGGNKATGNGTAHQCENIVCS